MIKVFQKLLMSTVSIILLLLILHCRYASCQELRNVDFQSQGNTILINYDFHKAGWRKCYNVQAFYSFDGEPQWYPIRNASGDIGQCVGSKNNNQIRWPVNEQLPGIIKPLQVKVVAEQVKLDDHLLFNGYRVVGGLEFVDETGRKFYNKNNLISGSLGLGYGWFRRKKAFIGFLGLLRFNRIDELVFNKPEGIRPLVHGTSTDFKIGPMFKLINSQGFELVLFGTAGLTIYSDYLLEFNTYNAYKFSSDVYNRARSYQYKGLTVKEKNNPDKLVIQGEKSIEDQQQLPFPATVGIIISLDWLDITLSTTIVEFRDVENFQDDFQQLLKKSKVRETPSFYRKDVVSSLGIGFNF